MRRWLKVVIGIGCALVVIAATLGAVSIYLVRHSFPDYDDDVDLPSLGANVEVVRDSYAIPQIYADNADDLFAAQGYVHAQDRFFEMDFRRHLTAGTLSELFGSAALDTDEVVRAMGWRRTAEQELSLLSPDTRRYLDDYARGVNAWLDTHSGSSMSLEYVLFGLQNRDYDPAPWTAVDSLAWLKAMAYDLGGNADAELDRLSLSGNLTTYQINQLYPPYPYSRNAPIVSSGTIRDGRFTRGAAGSGAAVTGQVPMATDRSLAPVARGLLDRLHKLDELIGAGTGLGSNSFVVSGAHTVTGKPLLANDPHLDASLPGIWEQMGLHCRTVSSACPYDVTGFTFSGFPGVIIGHNNRIAWGFTNENPDVQDYYVDKLTDGGTATVTGSGTSPISTRTETFTVAGEDQPVSLKVRTTRHGPVLSDVIPDLHTQLPRAVEHVAHGTGAPSGTGQYVLSLRWTALQPGRTADAVFRLDRAQNLSDFRGAASRLEVPAQNLVYADTSGTIAYQAPGLIPIRGAGDGEWPAPGWDASYDWKGWIPFAQLPYEVNPSSGVIVTANQAVIGQQYPRFLTTEYDYGFRSQQILNRLAGTEKLDVSSMGQIQLDTTNRSAAILVPYLLRLHITDAFTAQGQRSLRGWNYTEPADSSAAAFYNVVWRDVLALTFRDQLPKESWPNGDDRWFEIMRSLVADPTSSWWDDVHTKKKETRDDILLAAMTKARGDITREMARDPDNWQWGRLHTLELTNQTFGTSGIGIIEAMFNRGPYDLGGGTSVVDATSWDASTDGFAVTSVPSMRMVVDLSDLDDSRWINLTGVSGHAFDAHYTDQTELWAKGETLPWAYSREAVDRAARDRQTFKGDG